MTDPVRSNPDPWAGSPSKRSLPLDPVAAHRQLEGQWLWLIEEEKWDFGSAQHVRW